MNSKTPIKVTVVIVVSILALMPLLPGCGSDTTMATEVVDSLLQINAEAIERTDTEVAGLDEDLKNATTDLARLDNVVEPALEWVELQKSNRYSKGTWVTDVFPQRLSELRNDWYEIIVLQYVASNVGSDDEKYYPVIKIRILTNDTVYGWEQLDIQIRDQIWTLTQQRSSILQRQHQSASVLANVLTYKNEWKVKNTGDNEYSISGPGLGLSGTGVWTYNSLSKKIVPANSDAEALRKVLAAETQ